MIELLLFFFILCLCLLLLAKLFCESAMYNVNHSYPGEEILEGIEHLSQIIIVIASIAMMGFLFVGWGLLYN